MKFRKGIAEAFQVKNTPKGKKRIKMAREIFKDSDYRVIVRGRNKDRRKAIEKAGLTYNDSYRSSIPLKFSTHLAVYIVNQKTGYHLKK